MSNRLEMLSFALRHPENWPPGFEWNYHDCHHCAMGLSKALWPTCLVEPSAEEMTRVFGIPDNDAKNIFLGGRYGTTPEAIADKLDEFA